MKEEQIAANLASHSALLQHIAIDLADLKQNSATREQVDAVAEDMAETKEQAKKTNGRVTSLELWRARVYGALAVCSIATPVVTALLLKALNVA